MPEEIIVEHCAPTLAGVKTANMFSCSFVDRQEMLDEIRKLNHTLVPRGLRIVPLRYRNGKALLYLYRPQKLKKDLNSLEAREILLQSGYDGTDSSIGRKLGILIHRIAESEEFPHEVGLFLSYPPEDVRGFIDEKKQRQGGLSKENRDRNVEQISCTGCKCVGAWKVYGNEEKARASFRTFEKCTKAYRRCLQKGMKLEDLVVKTQKGRRNYE